MDRPLSDVEARVLGALIEKEMTTPDYYPLSLNALTNACNQSSNREPVMQLEESAVAAALDTLRRESLVRAIQRADSRVMKYQHLAGETMSLAPPELALLDVLLLRGAQTAGELRTRGSRLHPFEDLASVEAALDGLIQCDPPLVARLSRRPGQKEIRFAHLLSGEPATDAATVDAGSDATSPSISSAAARVTSEPASHSVPDSSPADRIAALEVTVAEMRRELADVHRQLDEFRRQFE